MFFENDDELDYEEENESFENKTEIQKKNSKTENAEPPGCEDGYLQIDVNEKEELESIEKIIDITKREESKPQKNTKGNEKSEDVNTNSSECNNFTKEQPNKKKHFKKTYKNNFSRFFENQPQKRVNVFRGVALKSRIPDLKFRFGNVPNKPLKYIKHQPSLVGINGKSINNQMSLPLHHLMKNDQKILSSFWSNPSLLQQTNLMNLQRNLLQLEALFPAAPPITFSGQAPMGWPAIATQPKLGIESVQSSFNQSINNNKNKDRKNPFGQQGLLLSTPSNAFSNLESLTTNFNQPNQELLKTTCSVLQETEKQLLKQKKEARLKRFMGDENKNLVTDVLDDCQNGHLDYGNISQKNSSVLFQKKIVQGNTNTEEKCRGIFSIGSSITCERGNLGNPQLIKPNLNKELLIKKKNPFETPELSLAKVKKEKPDETESQLSFAKTNTSDLSITRHLLGVTKQKNVLNPNDRSNLRSVSCKNGNDMKVTFVRTISKSFEELGLAKTVLENSNQALKNLTQVKQNLTPTLKEESFLTGCIVKIFNIPNTSTINEIIELCNPIGRVLEVKLNVPKENSAVIRFAKSTFAENFYSLYHGQKYRDNFLNVIIV